MLHGDVWYASVRGCTNLRGLQQAASCFVGLHLVCACLHLCVLVVTATALHLLSTAGVGKMTWLLDFEGYSMRNAPAIRTSLAVLHTLQVRRQTLPLCLLCVLLLTQDACLHAE
jgi:hypothetical protein